MDRRGERNPIDRHHDDLEEEYSNTRRLLIATAIPVLVFATVLIGFRIAIDNDLDIKPSAERPASLATTSGVGGWLAAISANGTVFTIDTETRERTKLWNAENASLGPITHISGLPNNNIAAISANGTVFTIDPAGERTKLWNAENASLGPITHISGLPNNNIAAISANGTVFTIDTAGERTKLWNAENASLGPITHIT